MTTLEDIAIRIDGDAWRFWEAIEITNSIDNFSTINFTAPFEPDRQEFRDTFKPFTFKDLAVDVSRPDGSFRETVFVGQMVQVEPQVTPESVTVECGGYALPGILADVNVPISDFPIEFNGMTLRQIAERLAEPFDLTVEFEGDDRAKFRRVKVKPEDKIYDFLGKLAQQRGMVINNTSTGNLRFIRSIDSGTPSVKLKEGFPPLVSVAATFSPQSYFSQITGFAKTKAGNGRGSNFTVLNDKLPSVVRPLSFTAQDVKSPDLPTAVQAKMARMFGSMVAYVVELPAWRDPMGELWQPNTLVSLEAPGAMVYNETTFLVRDVTLTQDNSSTAATLGLVLPGAFSGVFPEVFPWD